MLLQVIMNDTSDENSMDAPTKKNNANIVQYKYCYYLREKEFDYDI